jgi:hypothetical protein
MNWGQRENYKICGHNEITERSGEQAYKLAIKY